MPNEFKKSESISVSDLIKEKARKTREAINGITLVDVAIVTSIGLAIYSLSPWYLGAAVLVVGIRESKDYLVKKDTENRVRKLEESINMTMLTFDESLSALNQKIVTLSQNEQALSKDMKRITDDTKKALEDQKGEMNRFLLKQRDILGV